MSAHLEPRLCPAVPRTPRPVSAARSATAPMMLNTSPTTDSARSMGAFAKASRTALVLLSVARHTIKSRVKPRLESDCPSNLLPPHVNQFTSFGLRVCAPVAAVASGYIQILCRNILGHWRPALADMWG